MLPFITSVYRKLETEIATNLTVKRLFLPLSEYSDNSLFDFMAACIFFIFSEINMRSKLWIRVSILWPTIVDADSYFPWGVQNHKSSLAIDVKVRGIKLIRYIFFQPLTSLCNVSLLGECNACIESRHYRTPREDHKSHNLEHTYFPLLHFIALSDF